MPTRVLPLLGLHRQVLGFSFGDDVPRSPLLSSSHARDGLNLAAQLQFIVPGHCGFGTTLGAAMGIVDLAISDLAVFSISSPHTGHHYVTRGIFNRICCLFVGLRSANVIDHIHQYVVHHFPISSLPPPRNFSQQARPTAHRQVIGRSDSQGPKCIKATSAVTDSILAYVLIAVASIIAFRQTEEIKYE